MADLTGMMQAAAGRGWRWCGGGSYIAVSHDGSPHILLFLTIQLPEQLV
jgi:hypothetical protein